MYAWSGRKSLCANVQWVGLTTRRRYIVRTRCVWRCYRYMVGGFCFSAHQAYMNGVAVFFSPPASLVIRLAIRCDCWCYFRRFFSSSLGVYRVEEGMYVFHKCLTHSRPPTKLRTVVSRPHSARRTVKRWTPPRKSCAFACFVWLVQRRESPRGPYFIDTTSNKIYAARSA